MSKSTDISVSYLSRLEKGDFKPSLKVLTKIFSFYDLDSSEVALIERLAGYWRPQGGDWKVSQTREGVGKVDSQPSEEKISSGKPGGVEVELKVDQTPILYTDSMFVTTNDFGVVFTAAQSMGPVPKHRVVARLGMSKAHAEKFAEVLVKQLGLTNFSGKKIKN